MSGPQGSGMKEAGPVPHPARWAADLHELMRRVVETSVAASSSEDADRKLDLAVEDLAEAISRRRFRGTSYDEIYLEVTRVGPSGPAAASRAVVTATGLDPRGDPDPLGFAAGKDDEVEELCRDVLLDLRSRGLRSVARVLCVAEAGVANLVPWVFPGGHWVEVASGVRPRWLEVPGEHGGDTSVDRH